MRPGLGNNGVVNIASMLVETAARLPDKTALIPAGDGAAWDYARLLSEASRIARGLGALGVSRGDRVAIAIHNVPEFAAAYFGILMTGAVVVPLNVMLTADEIAGILRDAEPKVLIALPPLGAQAVEAAARVRVEHVFAGGDLPGADYPGGDVAVVEVEPDDLAVLSYTSGTTGEAKGAMLSHGNLIANVEQQMAIPEDTVGEDDVLFMGLPLFHIFGLNVTLALLVKNGATGILVERFDPVPAFRSIVEHKATVLFGAPTMYLAMVNTPGVEQYDLSAVRLAVSGAAPLSPEVLASFAAVTGVKIYEGYGLTETSPALMSNRMTSDPRPGSVGLPLDGVEVRLLDEAGNEAALGDPGEVVVRGPNVFGGYWHRPDETAAVLHDGWFHTGDIAVQDEEGFYYLVDRKRDLIIVSGFNVFPSEVEAVLLKDPRVSEAAVVGVPHAYTGEGVKAYVVLEDGAEATAEQIADVCKGHLARFKCPETVEIVDEFPHLVTGKVLKRALRDRSGSVQHT